MAGNLENELNCGITCILSDGTEIAVGEETTPVLLATTRPATVDGVEGTYQQFSSFVCQGNGNAVENITDGEFIPNTPSDIPGPPGETDDDLQTVGPYNINYDDILSKIKISPRNVAKFKFNSYNPKYEKNIQGEQVFHNLLPSFYTNTYYCNHKDENINFLENYSFVVDALTLNDSLKLNNNKVVTTPSSTPTSQIQEFGLKKYFSDYSYKLLEKIDNNEDMENIKNKMSYIFISPEEYSNFRKSESKKDLFPFYNEINIPAQPLKRFGKFLLKYKKFDDFKILRLNTLVPEIEKVNVKVQNSDTILQKRVVPITPSFEDVYMDFNTVPGNYTFFEEGSRVLQSSHTLSTSYINNLISDINFEQVYNTELNNLFIGNKDQPEVLYYKVVKYKDSISNPPVSIFCVANTDGVENISFIDTQIKINEKYIYKIYAIVFVQTDDIPSEDSQFLIQEEMTEVSVHTLNNPPMVPDFNVLPIMNSDNQIKILFNESVGERLLKPVSLTSEESDRVEKLRLAQGRVNTEEEFSSVEAMSQEKGFEFTAFGEKIFDERILYKNDDDIKIYEIYRLGEPPRTVDDFKKATKIRVSSDSFIDNIDKNRKYYYMFRAIDSHGNISNPSSVIEVILVSNGYTYPVIKSYSYDDYQDEQKSFSRSAKRYVRISPLPSNLLIGTVNSPTTAIAARGAKLNSGDIPLWGKRYKMRVTSKATGKKLDFNFTFNQVFFNSSDDVV